MKSNSKITRRSLLQLLAVGLCMPWKVMAAIGERTSQKPAQPDIADIEADGCIVCDGFEIKIVTSAAENDSVRIEVLSRLAGTEAIALFASQNPVPLLANFTFSHGAQPCVMTRIRLAQSQKVEVVVKADGKYYKAYHHVMIGQMGERT
ncbi:thiosulfate oxidation carrier protein SoxY [Methylobacillus sp.]|uniref:thiosulfate oxidation carrier protein SoxY n=1 Tax=Methylobacillus sp. TaxID=56818 RepID=UPI002FE33566